MASRGDQRLAIDTGHHVFFSEDEVELEVLSCAMEGPPISVVLVRGFLR